MKNAHLQVIKIALMPSQTSKNYTQFKTSFRCGAHPIANLDTVIHNDDEMLLYVKSAEQDLQKAVHIYFSQGFGMLNLVRQILEWKFLVDRTKSPHFWILPPVSGASHVSWSHCYRLSAYGSRTFTRVVSLFNGNSLASTVSSRWVIPTNTPVINASTASTSHRCLRIFLRRHSHSGFESF